MSIAVNRTHTYKCWRRGVFVSKSYHYIQFESVTLGFGRWQANQASVSVIIIVLKTNTRASSSRRVCLNCVLYRFTR